MVNFGPPTAEIDWRVWGTPENAIGFRVLASLLQRWRSTEVNQTFHGVWPSPGLVHCMYILGDLTARHSSNGRQPNCGVHLYSAGRPSGWASADILGLQFTFLLPFIIRLHRRTTYVGVAYYYRPNIVVCRSVTLVSPAKRLNRSKCRLGCGLGCA